MLGALNQTAGLGHELALAKLLEAFQERAKAGQVYVQQPLVAALLFAKNDKRGAFTGFWQNLPKAGTFKYGDFLAANALSGPGSIVHCRVW